MIHQLYVISKNGPLLFEKTYIKGATTTDPDLSSGLITALFHFTRDTHAEMIQKFEMEDLKLIFQESETLLFAATVDIKLPDNDAIDVIARIRDYWILHYGEQKETKIDRSKFKVFAVSAEQIITENLWWLGEGRKFSIKNQARYLKETITRPSRCVGARYLSKSFLLVPILLILGTIAVSFLLQGQVMGWSMQFFETQTLTYLLTMIFNIIAFWLVMSLMTAAINRSRDTFREVVLSSGYIMIFILLLFFVASKFYVDTIFSLIVPGFAYLNFNERIFLLNSPNSPIAAFVFLLWQAPGTVLLFAWVVLFAYVTYNIQRPKPLQHVLAIALSFVFVILIQSVFYFLFFGQTLLTPIPTTGPLSFLFP
ncbi:MAG: hypothetical protein ACXACH_01210 [Candidatus Hermodarchaeia archaeon]